MKALYKIRLLHIILTPDHKRFTFAKNSSLKRNEATVEMQKPA